MARPTIDKVRSLKDFATTFRWDVSFVKPAAVSGFPESEQINLHCETVSVPKLATEQFSVTLRGHTVKQPGVAKYDDSIELTLVETVDAFTHSFIKAWREAVWATNTGISAKPKSELQGQVILTQLDNQDKPFWKYTLKGAILSDYSLGSLEATGEAQKPTLTIAFDYFEDGPA